MSLAGLAPTVLDPYVLLEANRSSDLGGSRALNLTVYRDGTVLLRQDAGPRVARLTTAGVDGLMSLVLDADFLSMPVSVPIDPAYAGGFMSYVIRLRHDGTLVERATSNVPAPGHRAEADAIIALVERVIDIGHVLPATAWEGAPDETMPYVPTKLLFKVTTYDNPLDPADPGGAMLDVDAVRWPFETPMLRYGNVVDVAPFGAGTTSRCAVVTLADAATIADAIAPAPWSDERIPTWERMTATLTWKAGHGHINVSLAVLLPGEPDDCAVDGSWP
ncbi:MAG TPA: hypothetical protein VF494_09695 [Candidatus Limnocylindrales bacterium]